MLKPQLLKLFALACFFLSLPLGPAALADGKHDHSVTVCSAQNSALCAHLGLHQVLNSTSEGRFIAHFMTPDEAAVSNLQVILWMPDMGHGSSPVVVHEIRKNFFEVTEAWFIMPGTWLVKMSFEYAGAKHQIDIPLDIAE